MSLRSDPTIGPENPDPVTRNQPHSEVISPNTSSSKESEQMPGNYPMTPSDSTSSGGYGASPSQTWSSKSQRGTDNPITPSSDKELKPESLSSFNTNSNNSNGLIDQAADGTNLRSQLGDAMQGRDGGSGFQQEDEWGVEKGADKDF